MPGPASPTDTALTELAQAAAGLANQKLNLQPRLELRPLKQRDSVLLWSAAAVHPLDRLETAYQGIVLGAARGENDPQRALEIENNALSDFCFFDVQPLRLLGVQPRQAYAGEALPLMGDRLQAAMALIRSAAAELSLPARGPAALVRARADLDEARRTLWDTLSLYKPVGGWMPYDKLPLLEQARTALANAQQLRLPNQPAELRKALEALALMVDTGAAVQLFHNIGPFYLFRLLVRFRIESVQAITAPQRTECSGALTKLLNSNRWVTDFLEQSILALDDALTALDPAGNLLFFLKGGRALAYANEAPETGVNDWDTQIVINPLLDAGDWYTLFRRVYNLVAMQLGAFKRQFAVQLALHADELVPAADVALGAPEAPGQDEPAPHEDPDIDEDDGPAALRYHANCKAELIDIGMPRRESIEAVEQWALLAGKLVRGDNGMPIPGTAYYINEYLLMVREGLSGGSQAPGKVVKRVRRLYDILQAHPRVPNAEAKLLLPQSSAAVNEFVDPVAASAHAALLVQFGEAYDLAEEPGLATCFDTAYAANCADPQAVIPTLGTTLAAFGLTDGWEPDHNGMVKALAYAGYMSDLMQQHWRDRAVYMANRRAAWLRFVKELTGSAVFAGRAEIRVALSGSLAAALHAESLDLPPDDDLPPFDRVDLSILCRNADPNLPTVWDLIKPVVRNSMARSGLTHVLIEEPKDRSMRVPAARPAQIGAFTYAPLEGRIVLEGVDVGFPSLATVDDAALLALPDLIRQYRRWAGHTEELGTARLYRRALTALGGLLTKFDNPEPMGLAVAQLRKGQLHHLQLSSESYANGPRANYPEVYYPDRAYRLTLTANPLATRRHLTMPLAPSADRTIDVLVLNQGHGGKGEFDKWTADDLRSCIVEPLQQAGVTVEHLVLDFCLSASLIPTFIPLCANSGRIYGSLYATNAIILDTDTWQRLWPMLQGRQVAAIAQALTERMSWLTAGNTGLTHVNYFRVYATEVDVTRWLNGHPADRNAISVIRYLPKIKHALVEGEAGISQGLVALIDLANNTNLGDAERALLRPLDGANRNIGVWPFAQVRQWLIDIWTRPLEQVKALFKQRLLDILTLPEYQIRLNAADLDRLPVWDNGSPSLWSKEQDYASLLMSQAPGLTRCPSIFAVYNRGTRQLTLDGALLDLQHNDAAWQRLEQIDAAAPQEIPGVLQVLRASGAIEGFDGQENYLQ